jgi:glutamate N-acetyltransferase/amino-acid N-acetyltransferase
MIEFKSTPQAVGGVRWSTAAAGIKNSAPASSSPDVALMEIAAGSNVAGVFTLNAFAAAPVIVAKRHLALLQKKASSGPIFCLINSGNANAGTGAAGLVAADTSCQSVSEQFAGEQHSVLPFSTGVIGESLAVQKITNVMPALADSLSEAAWDEAARAIMTTDTVPKIGSCELEIDGQSVVLTGIAKGAGMIKPNMATMLAFVATDALIAQDALTDLLQGAVNQSFNRITVDGDTSTNDACVLAATGCSGVPINRGTGAWAKMQQAIDGLLIQLATAIIRDAEGATKFITIDVCGGASVDECLQVGYAIAESPLVKTAFFASDANWGRILAAIGRSGLSQLNIDAVEISLNGYCLCRNGGRVSDYDEQKASEIMAQSEIVLTIKLQRGSFSERLWTSDLSHDYVRINAEYRT